MTQSIIPFNFHSHAVRVVMRDGNPWFVATDVCTALGYRNPSKAIADHLDDDERSNEQLDRSRMGSKAVIISESGLYALILRSRKPEARKFAKWVTSEVMPSIRKTGGYSATGTVVNDDVLYAIWFLCGQFKSLHETVFTNKVPQALAWLGARQMSGALYDRLLDGLHGGVGPIEKALGPQMERVSGITYHRFS
ncbi:phage antirepressor protein [Xylella fastidiosa subsp. multiplex]|uniref:Phage antirepressor protein n=1 Tax=Xylella fastidiosa subsp. multiplex TaxID=644357 RepID=A0A9Q4MFC3_XYLFS|nr:Bro-N domain-containing protein [Xylella fastidiosa]MBE0269794.1 phage antirepressor protein [Xylella fastidiosa subsp. multiplex]MBE0276300.1 phage antirepressor protein [Xylella fastidiosa subsp. multiplex]MBE0278327.1 phage antirepressor protein [Xylella fastidiosa subsp. multiplex]MBE0283021.1 phage antirepressor protein [Xylella fastidiosa subsp. multiplex]MRT52485.1 phage antirepressor protein [Xylella fastidiosa subsp. multiplex]